MAVWVCALLHGASLSAEYWSATLLHSVYLYNRKVSHATAQTPFKGCHGYKPNLKGFCLSGSRNCVKRSGNCHAKLDHHDFTGIFLGLTATASNVWYIDINTGIIKTSHHAVLDEAWYLQIYCSPTSQLLYDLGLMSEEDLDPFKVTDIIPHTTCPPFPSTHLEPTTITANDIQLPLPLQITAEPPSVAVRLDRLI